MWLEAEKRTLRPCSHPAFRQFHGRRIRREDAAAKPL